MKTESRISNSLDRRLLLFVMLAPCKQYSVPPPQPIPRLEMCSTGSDTGQARERLQDEREASANVLLTQARGMRARESHAYSSARFVSQQGKRQQSERSFGQILARAARDRTSRGRNSPCWGYGTLSGTGKGLLESAVQYRHWGARTRCARPQRRSAYSGVDKIILGPSFSQQGGNGDRVVESPLATWRSRETPFLPRSPGWLWWGAVYSLRLQTHSRQTKATFASCYFVSVCLRWAWEATLFLALCSRAGVRGV